MTITEKIKVCTDNTKFIINKDVYKMKIKMKKTLLQIAILFLFAGIISCKNQPPTCTIISPSNGAEYMQGKEVGIEVNATDADGKIASVDILIDGKPEHTLHSMPFIYNWDTNGLEPGNYTITANAIDDEGDMASASVSIELLSNVLFKAKFVNDWVGEGKQCILVVSDYKGNVLGEKTFSGNDSYELLFDEIKNYNLRSDTITKIHVTTIVGDKSSQYIITNMNIPVGESWTWKGTPSNQIPDQTKRVTLNFQNMPQHKGYIISNKWGYNTSTYLPLVFPRSYLIHESPMDIYVKVNTLDGDVKYKWLNGVTDGSTLTDDLSSMTNATAHSINLNGNSYGYWSYLYGVSSPGNRYKGIYLLDYNAGDKSSTFSSLSVYYPKELFKEFRTRLYCYDENQNHYWYQNTYGDIPDSFTKINADFDLISGNIDHFEIVASGEYIQLQTSWINQFGNIWTVYSDKNCEKYTIPQLPESAFELFGINIKRSDYNLQHVSLNGYTGLSSNADIIEIAFKSDKYLYDVVSGLKSRVKYYPAETKSGRLDHGLYHHEDFEIR